MKRLRLLVVEDEFVVAMELHQALAAAGHEVCGTVGSGEEAVAVAAASKPDCVLMDVNVRGALGGVAAAREIRQRHGAAVVFLTGLPVAEVEQQVASLAPLAVLAKPIRGEELAEILQELANRVGRSEPGRGGASSGRGAIGVN